MSDILGGCVPAELGWSAWDFFELNHCISNSDWDGWWGWLPPGVTSTLARFLSSCPSLLHSLFSVPCQLLLPSGLSVAIHDIILCPHLLFLCPQPDAVGLLGPRQAAGPPCRHLHGNRRKQLRCFHERPHPKAPEYHSRAGSLSCYRRLGGAGLFARSWCASQRAEMQMQTREGNHIRLGFLGEKKVKALSSEVAGNSFG